MTIGLIISIAILLVIISAMYYRVLTTLNNLTHHQAQLSQDLNLYKTGLKSLMGVFRDRSQMLQHLKTRLTDQKSKPLKVNEIHQLEREYLKASNWKLFLKQYEQLDQRWLKEIENRHSLTSNDKKILIMIKLKLTNPDMAAVMSVSLGGLKKAKTRLRKKISSAVFEELEKA